MQSQCCRSSAGVEEGDGDGLVGPVIVEMTSGQNLDGPLSSECEGGKLEGNVSSITIKSAATYVNLLYYSHYIIVLCNHLKLFLAFCQCDYKI